MPGEMRRRVRPEEIHQVVARESLPRLDGEADQQGEVLARAKADLLTGVGQEQGSTQAQQLQVGRHRRLTAFPIGTIRRADQRGVNTLIWAELLPVFWGAASDRQRPRREVRTADQRIRRDPASVLGILASGPIGRYNRILPAKEPP